MSNKRPCNPEEGDASLRGTATHSTIVGVDGTSCEKLPQVIELASVNVKSLKFKDLALVMGVTSLTQHSFVCWFELVAELEAPG